MQSSMNKGKSEQIGRVNRRSVLKTILLNQPISRTEIAQHTGLTGASVSRITRDLIADGIVKESGAAEPSTGPGRRFISLSIRPEGGYLLGLSLNVFQQVVTLTDLHNHAVEQVELKFQDLSDSEAVIETVIAAMKQIVEKCRKKAWPLVGGAIAITGAIDPTSGVVRHAPVLNWRDVDLGPQLESALGIPFVVESLPNALNLAETRFGVAKGCNNVLLINCALGIGASLHLDGHLIRSTDFTAGLTGMVSFPFGEQGQTVTLDQVTGGQAAIRALDGDSQTGAAASPDGRATRLLEIVRAAEKADGPEREAVRQAGQVLGKVISLYAGLIHPRMIILLGPLGRCEIYETAARKALDELCHSDCIMPDLVSSPMSYQAAVRWLAIHEYLVNRDWDASGWLPSAIA